MIIVSFTEEEFLNSGLFVWEGYCKRKLALALSEFLLECGGCFIEVIVSVFGESLQASSTFTSIGHGIAAYHAASSVLWKNDDIVHNVSIIRHRTGALRVVLGIRALQD